MYRQYEEPSKVEQMLAEAQRDLDEAIERGDDEERIFDLHETVEELRERVNFAWQDDEYDEIEVMR